MSPWLLLFLVGALALYLLVVLPLSADQNPLGKQVVVAPTLDCVLKRGRRQARVAEVVRRWERGWNGAKGEQRITPDGEGRLHFPPVQVRSWAARVVPHEPITEQWLFVVRKDGTEEEEPLWHHVHRAYVDRPLELRIEL